MEPKSPWGKSDNMEKTIPKAAREKAKAFAMVFSNRPVKTPQADNPRINTMFMMYTNGVWSVSEKPVRINLNRTNRRTPAAPTQTRVEAGVSFLLLRSQSATKPRILGKKDPVATDAMIHAWMPNLNSELFLIHSPPKNSLTANTSSTANRRNRSATRT